MKSVSKTIVIRGGYGYGNFGDDALMAAVHGIAGRLCPAGDVGYLCRHASYVRSLLPDAQVLRLRDTDRLRAGMLLFGGGTQFYSFPLTSSRNDTFGSRMARLLKQPHLLPLKAARRLLQTPWKRLPDHADSTAALGVGLGPFVAGSAAEARTRELFAGMDYVSVRDVKSCEICRAWGVANLHHHTDLCFWPGFQAKYVPNTLPTSDGSLSRVGVIVRDWPHDEKGDAYHASLLTVANELLRTGRTVDFVLFAGKHDRVWLQRLRATSFNTVLWDPAAETVPSFIQQLASYDLVITARYHGAVFAALLGQPSICIDVEPKLALFANVLGAAGRCWRHPFDVSACLRMVREIRADYSHIAARLQGVRYQQSLLANEMVDSFLAFARRALPAGDTQRDAHTRIEDSPGQSRSKGSAPQPLAAR